LDQALALVSTVRKAIFSQAIYTEIIYTYSISIYNCRGTQGGLEKIAMIIEKVTLGDDGNKCDIFWTDHHVSK